VSIVALAAAICVGTLGAALWRDVKPWLTQALLARAWQSSLASGRHVKAWPWASSWPVARLTFPRLGIERYVLSGDGATPDLGSYHMAGTALPGEAGNSVIGTLDETDLAFLRELAPQTLIEVESMEESGIRYTVRYAQPLDPRDIWITKQEGPARLTLISCTSSRTLRPEEPPCYGVSAFIADEARSAAQAAATIAARGHEPAARWAPPQNTMFGRKTKV
jgi:sortase A